MKPPADIPIISSAPNPWGKAQRRLLVVLAVWLAAISGFVLLISWWHPAQRAVIGMAWGLIFLWICGCGTVMWRWRGLWRRLASRIPWPWGVKFVAGCTLLACAEEAVTTLMTNCAPLFGVKTGQAYITASANYLDVIFYHSVVVLVPMFVGWAVMLRWWKFSPFAVFLLYGLTGTMAEFGFSGYQGVPNFGFWIYVYGLMVWLPAFCVPENRPARPPPWWSYPLAVIMPFFFLPVDLVLAPWLWLTAKHPTAHFPPITGG